MAQNPGPTSRIPLPPPSKPPVLSLSLSLRLSKLVLLAAIPYILSVPLLFSMEVDDLADEVQSISFNSTATTEINRSTDSDSETTWTAASSCFSSVAAFTKPRTTAASVDPCWDGIRRVISESPSGKLSFSDLRFVQRLGTGDIGSVYLAELKCAEGCTFAAKVMDKKELASRNKEGRARTEREILEMLDHPFLPTLYATLESPKLSCLLTEFCPGGDLHVLRQRQPGKRFNESAVRCVL